MTAQPVATATRRSRKPEPETEKRSVLFYLVVLINSLLVLMVIGLIWFLFFKSPDVSFNDLTKRAVNQITSFSSSLTSGNSKGDSPPAAAETSKAEDPAKAVASEAAMAETATDATAEEKPLSAEQQEAAQQRKLREMREQQAREAEQQRLEKLQQQLAEEKRRAAELDAKLKAEEAEKTRAATQEASVDVAAPVPNAAREPEQDSPAPDNNMSQMELILETMRKQQEKAQQEKDNKVPLDN